MPVEYFEVEKILKHRRLPGKPLQYLIKWKGCSSEENSWQNCHRLRKASFARNMYWVLRKKRQEAKKINKLQEKNDEEERDEVGEMADETQTESNSREDPIAEHAESQSTVAKFSVHRAPTPALSQDSVLEETPTPHPNENKVEFQRKAEKAKKALEEAAEKATEKRFKIEPEDVEVSPAAFVPTMAHEWIKQEPELNVNNRFLKTAEQAAEKAAEKTAEKASEKALENNLNPPGQALGEIKKRREPSTALGLRIVKIEAEDEPPEKRPKEDWFLIRRREMQALRMEKEKQMAERAAAAAAENTSAK